MGNVSLSGDAAALLPDGAGRLSGPMVTTETLNPAAVVATEIGLLDSHGLANNRVIGPTAIDAMTALLSTPGAAETP